MWLSCNTILSLMIKIEIQLNRKDNTCKGGNLGIFSACKTNYRREGATTSKLNIMGNKIESSKAWRKDFATKIKDKVEIPSNHNCDIEYFVFKEWIYNFTKCKQKDYGYKGA